MDPNHGWTPFALAQSDVTEFAYALLRAHAKFGEDNVCMSTPMAERRYVVAIARAQADLVKALARYDAPDWAYIEVQPSLDGKSPVN